MAEKSSSSNGLARVQEIHHQREKRARELKAAGKKIMGYLCCYPPLEILTAADLVPYRIFGDIQEPITEADTHLETQLCAFVRSCFDIALKGKYDFLDGFIVPHSCDAIYFLYRIWRYHLKPSYAHFIHVPHIPDHATSTTFFKKELERFKKSLEAFVGHEISLPRLREAIELHNQQRALLRQLDELRKEIPPLVSGVEMTQTLIAVMSLPVEEANGLIRSVIEEVKTRPPQFLGNQARIFIYGSEIDDIALMQLVEESGAYVVADDLAVGTRFYQYDVEPTEDPLEGLAVRYLQKIKCPRTYWQGKPEERFAYIWDFIRGSEAKGAILYTHRFCDSHNLDVPDLRDYLRGRGVPVIHLEDDYSMSSLAPLKIRVQAFVEMLG